MAYTNTFKNLVTHDVVLDDETTLKIKLDQNKKSEALKIHIREYKTTPEYTGFTKNGVTIPIQNSEQLNNLHLSLNSFMESIKNHL